jgi:hypothetical protein
MPQVIGQVAPRRVAVARPLGQGFQADAVELPGHRVVHLPGRLRLDAGNLFEQLGLCLPLERPAAGEQFIEDDAEAEDVAAAIDAVSFAARLLGTHVGGGAGEARPLADILLPQGQAKVSHERFAALVEQDVARLDVAVHQPLSVSMVKRLGHRRRECHGLVYGQPGLLEPGCETAAVDVLRHDVARELLGAAHVVNRHDIGMVQVGDDARFGEIGFGTAGFGHQMGMRNLDRHRAAQLLVLSQVDEAEAASAQHPFDPVAPNPFEWWHLADRNRGGVHPWTSWIGIVHLGKSAIS